MTVTYGYSAAPMRYKVTVPPGVQPYQTFRAIVNGQEYQVTCPHNAYGGMDIMINVNTATPPQDQPVYAQPVYAPPSYNSQPTYGASKPGMSTGAGKLI